MDNLSVSMPAPSTAEIKTDKSEIKASEGTQKGTENTFEKQLSKVKEKSSKDIKSGKSLAKNNSNAKDISVNKSVDIKQFDSLEDKDAVNNMILSLINNVLNIPVEEINQILEEMNITPTDLLNQETFKQFLTHVYPESGDNQLLLNESKLKDISKLFSKLEQISTLIEGEPSNSAVEKLLTDNQLIKPNVTETEMHSSPVETDVSVNQEFQKAVELLKGTESVKPQTTDTIKSEEILTDSTSADEGIVSVKQLGLGLTIPIHAFNSTMNARLWDTQNLKSDIQSFARDTSIADQMINKIDIKSLGSHKEITMELSPKELGNLSIKIAENNGVLVANIRVDNEKTKELLLSEVAKLEQTLEKQGLAVSNVKVDVRQNESHSEMEKQKQKSAKRIQDIINRHLNEAEESAEMNEKNNQVIETEVDYMV